MTLENTFWELWKNPKSQTKNKQTNKKERKKRKQIFKKKKEGKAEIRESVDHK